MTGKKISVLFISSWYPTRIRPTEGNFVQKHAEAAARYAEVNFLHVAFDKSLKSKYDYQKEIRNNVTVHTVYMAYPKINFILFKILRYIRAYFWGFAKIYEGKAKPDVVHANVLIPVGLISYLFYITKKIPYVISEHWTAYLPQDPIKPGRKIILYRYFAKKASRLMPVTNHLAMAMINMSVHGKYSIVSNVVDTSLFTLADDRKDTVKHILHVSSLLDVQKNFSGILVALTELAEKRDDFMLEVIGDGDYEQYKTKIAKLNIADKIIFHGTKSTSEVASVMRKCDFLLLFSNYENFPSVISEAMSCGLPVLSTNVGGISEHVGKQDGLLLEMKNVDELIAQLDRMLDICRDYHKQDIRDYAVSNFSYEVVGKQFFDIYKQVICS